MFGSLSLWNKILIGICLLLNGSMERLPTLQYQLIGEFDTLLEYPASSAISRSNLLQMMAINIFAITNTAVEGMVLFIQCHRS